jgi:hypothetical protein
MSHAPRADKLLIKPAAGARPAPPRTRGQTIPNAHTKRPVTRRVTRSTATTRPATAPDRPTPPVLPSPEPLRIGARLGGARRSSRSVRAARLHRGNADKIAVMLVTMTVEHKAAEQVA